MLLHVVKYTSNDQHDLPKGRLVFEAYDTQVHLGIYGSYGWLSTTAGCGPIFSLNHLPIGWSVFRCSCGSSHVLSFSSERFHHSLSIHSGQLFIVSTP